MNDFQEKKSVSIPIMIDDVKESDDFQMSRCTYFSIASNLPSSEITEDPVLKIPSVMIGFTSLICYPFDASKLFNKPEEISSLFEAVEKVEGLYVDINDIWLPNFVFEKANRKRGSVFRILPELFKLAYDYQNGVISEDEFIKTCKKKNFPAEYSPEETDAFHKWGFKQIELASKYYKDNPKKWLKTLDKLMEGKK
jgi:hypothetical protein